MFSKELFRLHRDPDRFIKALCRRNACAFASNLASFSPYLPTNRVEWNLIGYLCCNDRSWATTMFAERTYLFAPITARAISPACVFAIRFIGP